jgi:nicotinamidase-related amidase
MSSIDPFLETTWKLVPGRTALVVIDPQNDFLHPEGWYAKSGVDISHMQASIEPTRRLVAAARARRVPIIWTRHGFRSLRDAGPFIEQRPFLKDGGLRQNTWGYQVLDGLGAEPDDWYVEKMRLSAFYQTPLETVLWSLNAASVRDFKPIVVPEATGTTLPHLHEPALEMMKVGWASLRPLEEALAELAVLPIANA